MKIWVDDLRELPKGYDIHLYTVDDTIAFIQEHLDEIELLDLDHDAGDYYEQGGDYIRILDWLEFEGISLPISIHSGNPVGIKNMDRIIAKNGWTYVPQDDEFMFADGF